MGLFSSNLSSKAMAHFSGELWVMYSSGVPLNRIMGALGEQSGQQRLRRLCKRMHHHLDAGATFSQAFEFEGKHFSAFSRTLIHVGEQCGQMAPAFELLQQYYGAFHKLQSALTQQVIYPCMLLITAFLLIPIFKFVVIGGANGMSEDELYMHVLWMVVRFFGGVFLNVLMVAGIYRLVTKVSAIEDFLMWLWPVHRIVRGLLLARFTWCMTFITRLGLPLHNGLIVSARATGSKAMEEDMVKCAALLRTGCQLTDALRESRYFPREQLANVMVGESSGELDKVFERMGNDAYRFSFHKMKTMVILVEVIFIVLFGMGMVVGLV